METFKLNSAAGIYSSLHDMIIWLKFNIAGGGGLISKQQLDNFRAPITPIEPNDLYEAEKITKLHYGYFWRNFDYNSLGKKIKVVEHAGGCAGMTSIISYLPHEKLGIIVMSNKFTQAPEILRSKFLNLIIQQKP
jgi:CubicO group peptidase (beta-lactamase class C family)